MNEPRNRAERRQQERIRKRAMDKYIRSLKTEDVYATYITMGYEPERAAHSTAVIMSRGNDEKYNEIMKELLTNPPKYDTV